MSLLLVEHHDDPVPLSQPAALHFSEPGAANCTCFVVAHSSAVADLSWHPWSDPRENGDAEASQWPPLPLKFHIEDYSAACASTVASKAYHGGCASIAVEAAGVVEERSVEDRRHNGKAVGNYFFRRTGAHRRDHNRTPDAGGRVYYDVASAQPADRAEAAKDAVAAEEAAVDHSDGDDEKEEPDVSRRIEAASEDNLVAAAAQPGDDDDQTPFVDSQEL